MRRETLVVNTSYQTTEDHETMREQERQWNSQMRLTGVQKDTDIELDHGGPLRRKVQFLANVRIGIVN